MNNNTQRILWILLIIVLVVLVVWGIIAAYNHSESSNNNAASSTTGLAENAGQATGAGTAGQSGLTPPSTAKKVPTILSINPTSGRSGIRVTINGSNFDLLNNFVEFAGYNLGNSGSNDNQHINFTVPSTIKSCVNGSCSNQNVTVGPGVYPIAVRNANGTSNLVYFTVTTPGPAQ